MNDDEMEIKCRKYSLTLTHVPSGRKVTCSLSENQEKWVVRGENYQGFFKDLETAYGEACRHLRFTITAHEKTKEGG